jgi:hypothetical protein
MRPKTPLLNGDSLDAMRVQKLHEQQFWWGPGESAPARPP